MPCFYPMIASRRDDGSVRMLGSMRSGFLKLGELTLPCGQCIGCRLEGSRQWAVRCMHEASLYEANCFVTMTYSDKWLPLGGNLCRRDFVLFVKRLRKEFSDERIRFFHCGEYGARFGRPHYHACLFNFSFRDKVYLGDRKGFPIWRSPTLERLWPYGRSEIGSVSFESAAYVARYIVSKVTGVAADDHYTRVAVGTGELYSIHPEYVTMSRSPGVGVPWLRKFAQEVYPADSVVVRGHLCKPPRSYDLVAELFMPGDVERVRFQRRAEARKRRGELVEERLISKEKCAISRLSLFERGVE